MCDFMWTSILISYSSIQFLLDFICRFNFGLWIIFVLIHCLFNILHNFNFYLKCFLLLFINIWDFNLWDIWFLFVFAQFYLQLYVSLRNLSLLFGLRNLLLLSFVTPIFILWDLLFLLFSTWFTTLNLTFEKKPNLIVKIKRSKTCTIHHQNNQSSCKVANGKHSKCVTHSISCKFHKSWLFCPNSCCNLEQCMTYKHYV